MSGYVREPNNANSPQMAAEFDVFYNASSTDISRGDVVAMIVQGTGGIQQSSSASSRVFGVAAEDIPAGESGMVQTYGYCDYVKTDGSVTSADQVLTPAGDGACVGYSASEIAANPELLTFAFAYNLDADDANNVGKCFIFR